MGGILGDMLKPPNEDTDEDATWVLRSSEMAGEAPSMESNQTGGLEDVSDLLRERENNWADNKESWPRFIRLLLRDEGANEGS